MGSWALAVIAAIVLVYAGLSRGLDRTPITAAIFFLTSGVVFGSKGLGWIDVAARSSDLRVLAEVTLTLVLFADASRIDFPALRKEYSLPLRLLGVGLPLTILAGWAVGAGLFSSLNVGELLILAVILAPTDAALGQSVVTDPRLPSRIRQGLNVESGLNDGICVPLLLIALAVAQAEIGSESTEHAVRLVVEAIGYGVLLGAVAGLVGAVSLLLAQRHGLAGDSGRKVLAVATAALAYGLAAPPGGSGFIAAFVAGFAFGHVDRRSELGATELVGELGELSNAATFILFGAAFVGPVLAGLTWSTAVYGLLSLTAIRMIPVWISLVGSKAKPPTVAFLGWFGPRGLASIVFTVIVLDEGSVPHFSTITVAVVFTIVVSVYAHGLSAHPLTSRYVRWFDARPSDRHLPMESVHAAPQRWRRPWHVQWH